MMPDRIKIEKKIKIILKVQELRFYLLFITFSKWPLFSWIQASTFLQKLTMTAVSIFSITLRIASFVVDSSSWIEPGLAWNTSDLRIPTRTNLYRIVFVDQACFTICWTIIVRTSLGSVILLIKAPIRSRKPLI